MVRSPIRNKFFSFGRQGRPGEVGCFANAKIAFPLAPATGTSILGRSPILYLHKVKEIYIWRAAGGLTLSKIRCARLCSRRCSRQRTGMARGHAVSGWLCAAQLAQTRIRHRACELWRDLVPSVQEFPPLRPRGYRSPSIRIPLIYMHLTLPTLPISRSQLYLSHAPNFAYLTLC